VLSHDRRALVLKLLREKGTMRVSELVSVLGVSHVTVLRDIDALVDAGDAERFHGGVAIAERDSRSQEGGRRPGPRTAQLRFGVLMPEGGYFGEVLNGIGDACKEIGAQQSLALSRYNVERDVEAIRALVRDKVDGLLLVCPVDLQGQALFADELRALPVPIVLIERRLNADRLVDGLDHVISDHEAGGRIAVEHLARLGHRRIAMISRELSPTKERVQVGFEHARRALGLDTDVPVLEVPNLGRMENGADQALAEAVATLRTQQVDAVLVHSDPEAALLARLAPGAGLRIPQDLAIVSYDDYVAEFSGVPLTAIAPAKRRLGSTAAELLARRIREGGDCPVTHLSLQPRLVIRDSCGASRTRRGPGVRRNMK